MKYLLTPALFYCMYLIMGCSGPYLNTPLGDGMPHDFHDFKNLAGEWEYVGPKRNDEPSPGIRLTLLDEETAHFRLKMYSLEDPDWKGQSFHFYLRRGAYHELYASVYDPEKEPNERKYTWMMLKLSDDSCVVWFPKPQAFKKAIKNGLILGEIIEGDPDKIMISDSNEKLMNLLRNSETQGVYFDWDSPRMFSRKTELEPNGGEQ